jgi:hypothetical protein
MLRAIAFLSQNQVLPLEDQVLSLENQLLLLEDQVLSFKNQLLLLEDQVLSFKNQVFNSCNNITIRELTL